MADGQAWQIGKPRRSQKVRTPELVRLIWPVSMISRRAGPRQYPDPVSQRDRQRLLLYATVGNKSSFLPSEWRPSLYDRCRLRSWHSGGDARARFRPVILIISRTDAMRHIERHRTQHIGWLRAAVLGANDGIVSTASLIVGVAAASS